MKMKIKKSIRILLLSAVILIAGLWATQLMLERDKWLYYNIRFAKNQSKFIEKSWVNLDGHWAVNHEDNIQFAQPSFKDDSWSIVRIGYYPLINKGNNKIIWFRKHFRAPAHLPHDSILLRLSIQDIHSQVYLNGACIADSCFIFNNTVCCRVPINLIKNGQSNLIAFRAVPMVINTSNSVSYIKDEMIRVLTPKTSFSGKWIFSLGDNIPVNYKSISDTLTSIIEVPGKVPEQNKKFNFTWYGKKFLRPSIQDRSLLLLLGNIKAYHEVYLNGKKIGGFIPLKNQQDITPPANQFNAYPFDGELMKDTNQLSVKVLNINVKGGITEGPVGIMSMKDLIKFIEY